MGLFRWFRRDRRSVFRFRSPAGGRWQYRDPIEIRDRLNAKSGEWSKLVELVCQLSRPTPAYFDETVRQMREQQSEATIKELAEIVAEAFRVEPLKDDGSGWSVTDRIELIASYLDWCAQVREETRPFAPSPPPTASVDGDLPGVKSLDSSSTLTG